MHPVGIMYRTVSVMSIGPGPGIVWYSNPVGPIESAATLSQVHMPPGNDAVNVSAG